MITTQHNERRTIDNGQRFVLDGVSWDFYERFLEELNDRRIFLTYDRGSLEIMSPSRRHELYGRLIGVMIDILAMELSFPAASGGMMTFKSEEINRGLEPDGCFWIANEPRIRGKFDFDPLNDPPPDLAIEIEVSRQLGSRLDIYAALGVPEVWRCDGEQLLIHVRQDDGTYAIVPESPSLPMLPPAEVSRLLPLYETMDETSWKQAVRDWVRAEVVPRYERDHN